MKRTDALLAYCRWWERHGEPPTAREFADELGVASAGTANRWMDDLWLSGYLEHAVPQRGIGTANDLVPTREALFFAESLQLREVSRA